MTHPYAKPPASFVQRRRRGHGSSIPNRAQVSRSRAAARAHIAEKARRSSRSCSRTELGRPAERQQLRCSPLCADQGPYASGWRGARRARRRVAYFWRGRAHARAGLLDVLLGPLGRSFSWPLQSRVLSARRAPSADRDERVGHLGARCSVMTGRWARSSPCAPAQTGSRPSEVSTCDRRPRTKPRLNGLRRCVGALGRSSTR